MHLADGLESSHLTVPDDEAQAALEYIRQFVYRVSGRSQLLHGYISEEYLDALVRIREASSNRDFNSAVEAIGVEGETSTKVTNYDDTEFMLLEIEATIEAERSLSEIARDNSSELSDEEKQTLYSLREIVENSTYQESVFYFTPHTVFSGIGRYLEAEELVL